MLDGHADVVVVGAGPAGCAAAATARLLGASTVLIDDGRSSIRVRRSGWSVGETASPGTDRLVREIFGTAAEAFDPAAHLPCPSLVSIWGSGQPAWREHLGNPLGSAWNLDRPRFDTDLCRAAAEVGVAVRRPSRLLGVEREGRSWQLTHSARGGTTPLRAGALVDATGRAARLSQAVGARRHHLDRLVALGATWPPAGQDQMAATHLEAAPDGWWYSTLVPSRRRVVVHLTDADLLPADVAGRRARMDGARSLALIGPLLAGRGNAARPIGSPALVSARSGSLDRFGGDRWVAAGDAAFSVDPLSGQGIVSALLTGRSAGRVAAAMALGTEGRAELERHHDELTANLDRAFRGRVEAYRREQRWPGQEFWARRHTVGNSGWSV